MIGSSRPVPVIAAPEPQSILTPSPNQTRVRPANFSKGLAMDSGFRRNDGLVPEAAYFLLIGNDCLLESASNLAPNPLYL